MPTSRGTGWREREAAGKARMAERIPAQIAENIRIAGERLKAEREAAAALALSQEQLRRETLCGCPACKATGEVTEAESAFIASALAYYRSKAYAADPIYLSKDRLLPRPNRAAAPVMPVVEPEPVKPSKPGRRAVVPPFLED